MPARSRPLTFRLRRRFALAASALVLAGSVVVAHSAIASDHMGSAVAVCIAVAETAGLALLARSARPVWAGAPSVYVPRPRTLRSRRARARQPAVPWARGSPVALQVLRF